MGDLGKEKDDGGYERRDRCGRSLAGAARQRPLVLTASRAGYSLSLSFFSLKPAADVWIRMRRPKRIDKSGRLLIIDSASGKLLVINCPLQKTGFFSAPDNDAPT